ncbi:MAG TPA: AraC family transcriptional regulator [Myxococcales bacterium]|nr:AraC family transcriptional regulator [Myxococcales bacterium]
MPRPRRELPVRTDAVAPLLELCARGGVDPVRLQRRFRLPEDARARPEVELPPTELGALFDAAARELGDGAVGLHLAESGLQPSRYGVAELAARASPTLGDALERLVRYGGLTGGTECALSAADPEGARFTLRFTGHPRGLSPHLDQWALAQVVAQARSLTGEPLAPLAVWFIHARVRDLEPLRAFFRTGRIHFGRPENGLLFPPDALALPLRSADARLLATADALAHRERSARPAGPGLGPRVAAVLRELVGEEPLRARAAATRLRMSVRTLQRRLEDEGTSFAALADGARREAAEALMGDPAVPLGEVAFRAGFSDFATFSRAFRRWTGQAPGAARTGTR